MIREAWQYDSFATCRCAAEHCHTNLSVLSFLQREAIIKTLCLFPQAFIRKVEVSLYSLSLFHTCKPTFSVFYLCRVFETEEIGESLFLKFKRKTTSTHTLSYHILMAVSHVHKNKVYKFDTSTFYFKNLKVIPTYNSFHI